MTRINRAEFLAKLETLAPGLSAQEVIEQSSCIVFRDPYAYTFNDEIAVRTRSPVKITGAVAAKPLLEVLRKLPEEEVEVRVSGSELRISGKRKDSGIRLESEITMPLDAVETPGAWQPLHAEFCEAVGIVGQCAGKDESQFMQTCVHIHPKFVEACDNMQASRYGLETGFREPSLVRRDSIQHITRLGVVEFSETEKWLHFRNPARIVISVRRFVEDYNDLTHIYKVKGEATPLPKGLVDAAERADVFARENAAAEAVKISLRTGKLTLTAESALGWYSETKKVKYDGKSISFLITPKILTAIVQRHNDCIVSPQRLKVDGGKFVYVTVLEVPKNEPEKESDRGEGEKD